MTRSKKRLLEGEEAGVVQPAQPAIQQPQQEPQPQLVLEQPLPPPPLPVHPLHAVNMTEQLLAAYAADEDFASTVDQYDQDKHGLYRTKGKNQIVVPNCQQLKARILVEMHDAQFAGHVGITKTLERISRIFWWPRMRSESDWPFFLSLAEFAVNNSWQESIQSTPFLVNTGQSPLTPALLELPVLLSTKNLRLKPGKAKKLLPRFIGPFKVLEHVGPVAVRLDLPPAMARMHPVFHVALLRPYTSEHPHLPPPVDWLDEAPLYEVEKLLAHRGAMALAVNRFVAASDLPQERSPNSSRLYPSKAICVMPRGEGGVGLPELGVTSTAMLAKMLAQLWSPRVRPWQPLTHSLLADPSHGRNTWVITDPTAPPSRGISPRLQAHVAALAELKLLRAVPPASQSFFSVLAEPLWYNAQVRMNPAAREAAAEKGWTHVRHVREAMHSPQLEGEARWAADLVRACLPEPWQGMVDRLQPPQPEWECLRVGLVSANPETVTDLVDELESLEAHPANPPPERPTRAAIPYPASSSGVGFVMRRTPMLQPSHWVGPNGRLYPLDPTGQGPLAAAGQWVGGEPFASSPSLDPMDAEAAAPTAPCRTEVTGPGAVAPLPAQELGPSTGLGTRLGTVRVGSGELQGSQPPRWLDTAARAPPRSSPDDRRARREERQRVAQCRSRRGNTQPATQPARGGPTRRRYGIPTFGSSSEGREALRVGLFLEAQPRPWQAGRQRAAQLGHGSPHVRRYGLLSPSASLASSLGASCDSPVVELAGPREGRLRVPKRQQPEQAAQLGEEVEQFGPLPLWPPLAIYSRCTQVQLQAEGAQGRVLRVDGELAGRPVSLVCVYAPAQQAERPAFYAECLFACLPPAADRRLLLMGGDFNCILAPVDRVGIPQGSQHGEAWVGSRGQGAEQLRQLVGERGLVDPWRHLHPSKRDLTHFSKRRQTGARLDRWYISEELGGWR
ncbi:hypothetical protein QJQ45_007167 [Haematococcus lacustris]|nr:hypothetical protein QJQ45_007167 [Haematococcus lacustris]